jgi:hypothetical protein
MADQHYSDLQVDHDSQYAKYPSSGPHDAGSHASTAPTYSDKIYQGEEQYVENEQPRSRRRICGLKAKTFYMVAAIIAIVIIAAAVGGGVGGSLAGKNNNATPADVSTSTSLQSSSTSSSTPLSSALTTSSPTATTSEISITTSTAIGPSETLLIDCPSSNNTFYNPPSSTGLWRKLCSSSYLNSNGINAWVNTGGVTSLNDCIALATSYNLVNATEIASGSSNIANAVCFRATITNDDFPGQCFGYTTTNSSGNFVTTGDTRCDSAALINQSF